jgi:hypothetical protein
MMQHQGEYVVYRLIIFGPINHDEFFNCNFLKATEHNTIGNDATSRSEYVVYEANVNDFGPILDAGFLNCNFWNFTTKE